MSESVRKRSAIEIQGGIFCRFLDNKTDNLKEDFGRLKKCRDDSKEDSTWPKKGRDDSKEDSARPKKGRDDLKEDSAWPKKGRKPTLPVIGRKLKGRFLCYAPGYHCDAAPCCRFDRMTVRL